MKTFFGKNADLESLSKFAPIRRLQVALKKYPEAEVIRVTPEATHVINSRPKRYKVGVKVLFINEIWIRPFDLDSIADQLEYPTEESPKELGGKPVIHGPYKKESALTLVQKSFVLADIIESLLEEAGKDEIEFGAAELLAQIKMATKGSKNGVLINQRTLKGLIEDIRGQLEERNIEHYTWRTGEGVRHKFVLLKQNKAKTPAELLKKLTESIGAVMDCMIGERLECAGWHKNGDLEPAESFFQDNGVIEAYEEAKKFLEI